MTICWKSWLCCGETPNKAYPFDLGDVPQSPAESYRATQTLIRDCRGKEHPTALVVVNDLFATGVLTALDTEHIRVPEEMSVVSRDNAPSRPTSCHH